MKAPKKDNLNGNANKVLTKTYLPAGTAIRIALVLEVWHILDHPLVNLAQSQSFVGGRSNGMRDEIRIG